MTRHFEVTVVYAIDVENTGGDFDIREKALYRVLTDGAGDPVHTAVTEVGLP